MKPDRPAARRPKEAGGRSASQSLGLASFFYAILYDRGRPPGGDPVLLIDLAPRNNDRFKRLDEACKIIVGNAKAV